MAGNAQVECSLFQVKTLNLYIGTFVLHSLLYVRNLHAGEVFIMLSKVCDACQPTVKQRVVSMAQSLCSNPSAMQEETNA